jgi:hypothetical protein
MTDYRITDTRTGGEVEPGGTITDHCGHTAKLIRVASSTTVVAEWMPDGLTGEYDARGVFSLAVETLGGPAGMATPASADDAYMADAGDEEAYFGVHLEDSGGE